jgi:tRNA/rRNA methyltransferase
MSLAENVYFILVEPQMGENIGAVARVISNFGFHKLRIVAPRDGWPNEKAFELAAHGKFILDDAEIFPSLNEAIKDVNYLIATSASKRDMEKQICRPKELFELVARHAVRKEKIGVMLGRERSGLTNEEMVMADVLCSINTSKLNSSMNIAQAACVLAYELSEISLENQSITESPVANKQEIESLFQHLKSELDRKDYFKAKEKEERMFQNIRNIFTKAKLTEQEVRTLRGVIRTLSEEYKA